MSELKAYLSDVESFLIHERVDVRKEALDVLKNFTSTDEHIQLLVDLNLVKHAVRLVGDSPQTAGRALQILVNLSASEVSVHQVIKSGGVNVCMDFLRAATNFVDTKNALSVLNNVSNVSEGAIEIMQEGKAYEGLNALRLFGWFNNRDLQTVDADDWALCGNVLCNLSQLESFRKMLVDPKRELLLYLCDAIRNPSKNRRLSALRMFHNLSYDTDKIFFLLNPETRIFPVILKPILAYNENYSLFDEDDVEKMLPDVQNYISSPNQKFDVEAEVRRKVLDIIHILARNVASRAYMKKINVYHIVRELHKYERELENESVDDFIEEELIPYFILDDDDADAISIPSAITRMERLSQGLLEEEEEAVEEVEDASARKPVKAMLAPDEDGEIEDAKKHNDKMAALHEAEELAMEERAKNLGKHMYSPKEDSFDALSLLQ